MNRLTTLLFSALLSAVSLSAAEIETSGNGVTIRPDGGQAKVIRLEVMNDRIINAARLYKLNPDNALEMTNQKFIRRFNYIEQRSREMGKAMTEMTLEEMDGLWNEAKEREGAEGAEGALR